MNSSNGNSLPIHMTSVLLVGVSVLVILIFLYCGLYAVPSADDYAYANAVLNGDFWQAQADIYKSWSGRYTATFLITAVGKFLLEQYWIVPWTSILLLIFSSYVCFWTIFFHLRSKDYFYTFPITFIALFMSSSIAGHGVSVINEGFFWLAGAATYQVGAALYFFAVSAFIWMARGKYRLICSILSVLFISLAIGSNETLMLLSVCTFSALSWYYRKQLNSSVLLILGLTIACCCVVFFAPGNNVRSATANGKDLFSALGICIEKTVQQYTYLLINPLLWLFVIYYNKLISELLDEIRVHFSQRQFCICLIILVYGLYFPVAWALNSGAPDRLVSFIGFLGMVASVFFVKLLIDKVTRKLSIKAVSAIALLLLIILFSTIYEPLKVSLLTLSEGPEFHMSHTKRNNYIKQMAHEGASSVGVDKIERNKLLLFNDLDSENHSFAYAKYHGLESVFIVQE
ncbi:MAG: hypothetical protein D3915_13490 [Candidatus Electrothrix sp. AU1_5]|nr:hypothetical protein [Candidatus Electrothrix gigas]